MKPNGWSRRHAFRSSLRRAAEMPAIIWSLDDLFYAAFLEIKYLSSRLDVTTQKLAKIILFDQNGETDWHAHRGENKEDGFLDEPIDDKTTFILLSHVFYTTKVEIWMFQRNGRRETILERNNTRHIDDATG